MEIVRSEDILVTRKQACRTEAINRFLACCSSLVCIAKLFGNSVEGEDSPALGLNGDVFQFLRRRKFSWTT